MKNDKLLFAIGLIAVGFYLAHSHNEQVKKLGQQLERDGLDDELDFFL